MPRQQQPTAFALWMRQHGFTDLDAAEALGWSVGHIRNLRTGRRRDGQLAKVKVDFTTRLAMAAVDAGLDPIDLDKLS